MTTTLTKDRPAASIPSEVVYRKGYQNQVAPTKEDQWAILAGLRLILALIVVTGHTWMMFVGGRDWTYIGRWLNQEGSVFGFFLISGYSIAASLDKETKHFYQRRMQRIWPLYLCTLLLGGAVVIATGFQFTTPKGYPMAAPSPADSLGTLLMLQSFVTAPIAYIGPTWSLSIEWWLYMIAPLLRRLSTPILFVPIAVSAYCFVTNFVIGIGAWLPLAWLWILGFVYYRNRAAKWSTLLLAIPCMIVLHFGGVLYLATILTVAVLATCRDWQIKSERVRQFLTWGGDLSYPLYLIHMPALIILSYWGIRNSVCLVGGSVAVAAAMLHGIDYPLRARARRRLENA